MLGITGVVAITFWLSGSFIEYKIIKTWPRLEKLFNHPVGQFVVSIGIGLTLTAVLGAAVGVGATLGNMLGLATNQFTYSLYSKLEHFNTWRKGKFSDMKEGLARNKETIRSAFETIKYGFKGVMALLYGFLWVVGLPFRINSWVRNRRVKT